MPLLISYDLNKTKDYDSVINAIEALGPSFHVLKSAWIVVTSLSAPRAAEYLERFLDADDDFFVVDIKGKDSAWSETYSEEANVWLKQNLGR